MEGNTCPLGFNQTKNAGKIIDVPRARTLMGSPSLPLVPPMRQGQILGPLSLEAGHHEDGMCMPQRRGVVTETGPGHLGSTEKGRPSRPLAQLQMVCGGDTEPDLRAEEELGGGGGAGILEEAVSGAYTCVEAGPRLGQPRIASHLEGLVLNSSVAAFDDYQTRRCQSRPRHSLSLSPRACSPWHSAGSAPLLHLPASRHLHALGCRPLQGRDLVYPVPLLCS